MSQNPFLQKENTNAASGFVSGPLWADFKRCLLQRNIPQPEVGDTPDVAAAKAHQRTGFEKCIERIEQLPFEADSTPANPFDRPALASTED